MNGRGLTATTVAGIVLAVWAIASIFVGEQSGTVALDLALQPPGRAALLGTDPLGRPVGGLVAAGARTALIIGLCSVALAGTFGVLVGAVAGYVGGRVDAIAMRIVDVLMAFPGIILAIAITAILGPSLGNIVLALTILGWTGFARLARGQVLQLKQQPYVLAIQTQGATAGRIVTRHLIPNLLGPVTVQATFAVAGAILAESSLSFLGLGDPTLPSWGGLLSEGVRHLRQAPWLSLAPGAALFAVVLSLNLCGDALADRAVPGHH